MGRPPLFFSRCVIADWNYDAAAGRAQPSGGHDDHTTQGHGGGCCCWLAHPARLAIAPAALAGTVSTAAHPIGSGTVTYHFNGKCMEDNHGSSANGTKVQIWTCNGHARSQKWTGYSDGTLRINGKCLDVTGHSTQLGAKVEIWTCNGGSNQKWQIGQTSQNDFGPIVGAGSGNALADPGQSNINGTQLQMGRYLGDETMQPWHVSFHPYPTP